MELNRTRRWFFYLTLVWVMMLLGLGSWWLYLVFKLHNIISKLNIPELGTESSFLNMMRWEGSFFFIFLLLLGVSLFIMYLRDMRKSNGMQAFFASLSHELKTPLASMRLQAEVIKDLIDDDSHDHSQLSNLTHRLIEDTHKLESELEKSLQLSRIEQDAVLTLVPVSLERYLKRQQQRLNGPIKLELALAPDALEVLADELAMEVVFKNLFENTLRHNHHVTRILVTTIRSHDQVIVTYDDFGKKFEGRLADLGTLFYKHNSTKGTGIGLYLIKSLMKKMMGSCVILNEERLKFQLTFQRPTGETDV